MKRFRTALMKLRSAITVYIVLIIIYLVIFFVLGWWLSWWITGVAAVVPILAFLLWWGPKKQVASLSKAGAEAKDVFKAENDARTTLAQILGGLAVLIGLCFAFENIRTTAEGQITDRFYKAIEQLGAADDKGNPKLELRLGGIYALERIARDSERDHWPIMEVLTAYVREHDPWKETTLLPIQTKPVTQEQTLAPLGLDIQAIMTVIGRRESRYEKNEQRLDLHGTDLHGVNLTGAYLMGADLNGTNLWDAHLEGANLTGAHLEDVDLTEAHLENADLQGVNLMGAHLNDTNLTGAHLNGAHLTGANLEDVDLTGAHLENADLQGAHLTYSILAGVHLEGAQLLDAHLEHSNLRGVNLTGLDLTYADLAGTNLVLAIGLTQAQINSARGDATTRLPPGLIMPEAWKKKQSSG